MNGIILINKEKGYTSHDVVYKVKKMFNEKVGHIGTLDPEATGVLPLLIGKGTLCSKYLVNHDKTYEVELKLGEKTTTGDIEGEVIETVAVRDDLFNEENIKKVLNEFLGEQYQIPPKYSAIKVNGKKLYEYARKGEDVDIKPRKIFIYDIELLGVDEKEKLINFKVSCSKGTYIRSLCEDIANKMETVGHMKNLKRTKVGEFFIEDTVSVSELEKNIENSYFIEKYFITLEKIFLDKDIIYLNDRKLKLFLNGVRLTCESRADIYRVYNGKEFIGIGIVKDNLLKRDIVI